PPVKFLILRNSPVAHARGDRPMPRWRIADDPRQEGAVPMTTDSRAGAKPAIVIADHTRWGTFSQLAGFVRRSGFRAIRVTTSPKSWYNGFIDKLLYDRVIYLDAIGLQTLGAHLTDESVIDIQTTEFVTAGIASGDLAVLPDRLATQ